MKCDICKGNTVILRGQRYQYTESGLNNLYLDNIELRVCERCGDKSPRIPRIVELHAAIGHAIALQQAPLRGNDIRFLRKQLGMQAREWARLLRVDVSTFSRWENDERQLGPQSEALVRFLYFRLSEEKEGRYCPKAIVEQIASVNSETMAHIMLMDLRNLRISWYGSVEDMPPQQDVEMGVPFEGYKPQFGILGKVQPEPKYVQGEVAGAPKNRPLKLEPLKSSNELVNAA